MSAATETGPVNQKVRTRQALIEAATELLEAGANPTLADVAEHALVSKTTAYRQFASIDALVTEVFFNRDFSEVELVIGPEAIIATRDVCGLGPNEARAVTWWAAEAIVAQARDGDHAHRDPLTRPPRT